MERKKILLIEVNEEFISDLQGLFMLDPPENLDIMVESDLNDLDKSIQEENPDEIVVSESAIDALPEWDYDIPIRTYVTSNQGIQHSEEKGLPCFGVIRKTKDLLYAIENDSIVKITGSEKKQEDSRSTGKRPPRRRERTSNYDDFPEDNRIENGPDEEVMTNPDTDPSELMQDTPAEPRKRQPRRDRRARNSETEKEPTPEERVTDRPAERAERRDISADRDRYRSRSREQDRGRDRARTDQRARSDRRSRDADSHEELRSRAYRDNDDYYDDYRDNRYREDDRGDRYGERRYRDNRYPEDDYRDDRYRDRNRDYDNDDYYDDYEEERRPRRNSADDRRASGRKEERPSRRRSDNERSRNRRDEDSYYDYDDNYYDDYEEPIDNRRTPKRNQEEPERQRGSNRRPSRDSQKNRPTRPEREPSSRGRGRYDDREDDIDYQVDRDLGRVKDKAKVITIYSAKGGVGKTTISCELAAYLSCRKKATGRGEKYKVCIVDYNIDFGDVAMTLDYAISGDKAICMTAWADDIKERLSSGEEPEDITYTERQIEKYLQVNDAGLYALVAPFTNEDSMDIGEKELEIMLDNLIHNGGFDYIICDTGNNTRDSSFIAVENADVVGLVITQDINAAKCNRSFLNVMNKMDFDMNKIQLIINKALPTKETNMHTDEIIANFENPITRKPYDVLAIIKDTNDARKAGNDGQPLVYDTSNEFTKSIGEMSTKLIGEDFVLEAVPKKGFFAKLFGKKK